MFIDSHCHVIKEEYEDVELILSKIKDNIIINAGTNSKTNKEVLETLKYKNVYGVIGIHPEEVNNVKDIDYDLIIENISNPKIVGIGEIGLDYYWVKDNKDKQKEVFIKQIKIAKEYNKPIVIHSRDAINDTYEILKEYGKDMKIVMHCYSGSVEMAHKFLDLGIYFGIGGVITFKNSKQLKEVVEMLPMERIILETDSPYLTPEPYRGKKNDPTNIPFIASKIAEIKGLTKEEVIEITTSNTRRLFDLDI